MDLKEFVGIIEKTIEKEDIADEDIESKRRHIAEIFDIMAKNGRDEIDIELWRRDKHHKVIFHSNGTLELDGEIYARESIPIDIVMKLDTIIRGTFPEDVVIKTKRA